MRWARPPSNMAFGAKAISTRGPQPPFQLVPPADVPAPGAPGSRQRTQPTRLRLRIQFESRPDEIELARLIETTVWVNEAHPAYQRAVASRSEGYHLALSARELPRICVCQVYLSLHVLSPGIGKCRQPGAQWRRALREIVVYRPPDSQRVSANGTAGGLKGRGSGERSAPLGFPNRARGERSAQTWCAGPAPCRPVETAGSVC
jgi:hypothetical protein